MLKRLCLFGIVVFASAATPLLAQQQAPTSAFGPPTNICGTDVPSPVAQPPAGSGPVVYLIGPCWEAQGNQTVVEAATYLYYIQLKASSPSQNMWFPFNETTEKT